MVALSAALLLGAAACGDTESNPTATSPAVVLTARPPKTRTPAPPTTRTPGPSETVEPTRTAEPTRTPRGSETPTEDPGVTPTGTSTDCDGPDPNDADLFAPNRPPDDILRLTDKSTTSLRSYFPQDLVQLGPDYSIREDEPGQLRAEAAKAVKELIDAAAADDLTIKLVSGFRSCPTQVVVFNNHVANLGLREAERQSARPGHSEHQLGLAADLGSPSVNFDLVQSFGETAEGKWLFENAERFGFVLSYPEGAEEVTGYFYEPWHWRWVGSRRTAKQFNASGMTLNQWLREKN